MSVKNKAEKVEETPIYRSMTDDEFSRDNYNI